jgi:hypothetical protein
MLFGLAACADSLAEQVWRIERIELREACPAKEARDYYLPLPPPTGPDPVSYR